MSDFKVGDMYAPKSIFMAIGEMASDSGYDPIRRVYDALRKSPKGFNTPRRISAVYENTGSVYLEGISVAIKFADMKGLFNPVYIAQVERPHGPVIPAMKTQAQEITIHTKGEEVPRENSAVVLDSFFKTAHRVKPRTISDVVHHLSSEVGEIAECLVQPHRGGDIVEESVDAILCALDIIYLQLRATHGTTEIAQKINEVMKVKLEKWYETCKTE